MHDYVKPMIGYLFNRRDYVSGQELSEALGVSTKTINRVVKQINGKAVQSPVVESQRGRGYRLNFQNYFMQRDQMEREGNAGDISSVERRNEIIKRLLITAPHQYRMEDVWGRFYLSESAISSDLKTIRFMLERFHLTLNRVSSLVWVEGSEADIRRAIAQLINTDDMSGDRFLQPNQTVQQRDAAFVTHQMELVEETMQADIPYPYSVNLFTHLYILIERCRNVSSLAEEDCDASCLERMDKEPQIRKVCEKVVSNVDEYLGMSLPRIEVYFLFQYLTSSRLHHHSIDQNEVPDQVRDVTDYLIYKVTEDPEYRNINRRDLFAGLSQHMKPLLNRLENNIKVTNNLLEQIKLEYPHLFATVKNAAMQLSERFQLADIDDEEIGFITVYFAQAVESSEEPINVLLVCTTGLGTAQLLRSKIEKKLPDFHIVQTVAVRNLPEEIHTHPETDLIVSTIVLPHEITVPSIVVSAMLTVEDQERLEREAGRIRQEAMER